MEQALIGRMDSLAAILAVPCRCRQENNTRVFLNRGKKDGESGEVNTAGDRTRRGFDQSPQTASRRPRRSRGRRGGTVAGGLRVVVVNVFADDGSIVLADDGSIVLADNGSVVLADNGSIVLADNRSIVVGIVQDPAHADVLGDVRAGGDRGLAQGCQ
jgi:hypothetical protein